MIVSHLLFIKHGLLTSTNINMLSVDSIVKRSGVPAHVINQVIKSEKQMKFREHTIIPVLKIGKKVYDVPDNFNFKLTTEHGVELMTQPVKAYVFKHDDAKLISYEGDLPTYTQIARDINKHLPFKISRQKVSEIINGIVDEYRGVQFVKVFDEDAAPKSLPNVFRAYDVKTQEYVDFNPADPDLIEKLFKLRAGDWKRTDIYTLLTGEEINGLRTVILDDKGEPTTPMIAEVEPVVESEPLSLKATRQKMDLVLYGSDGEVQEELGTIDLTGDVRNQIKVFANNGGYHVKDVSVVSLLEYNTPIKIGTQGKYISVRVTDEVVDDPQTKTVTVKEKTTIFINTQKEFIHCFPGAANPPFATDDEYDVSFLAHPHRHMFGFRVETNVFHDDRDIEFIQMKRVVNNLLKAYPTDLGHKSCEMLCKELIEGLTGVFGVREWKVTVDEDGENGATVISTPIQE